MAPGGANKGIVIYGVENWYPVLLNILNNAEIKADILSVGRRRQFVFWLFSSKSRPYRIIYSLGGCSAIICILARLQGKYIVSHWIGTDVMRYQGKSTLTKRLGIWVHQHFVALGLSDSEIIREELKAIGIETYLLRLLPQAIVGDVTALPEKPTVLSYWSDERFDFYGGPIVLALARAFPEVTFLVANAHGEGLTDVPKNVRFLGLVDDMPQLYQKCTCLVRMPRHDGLSAMVLEAMAHGRYVIYNYKFPFTSFSDDFNSAAKALQEIIGKKQPNSAGADYVKNNFNINNEANSLRDLMEKTFENF